MQQRISFVDEKTEAQKGWVVWDYTANIWQSRLDPDFARLTINAITITIKGKLH